MYPNFLSPYIKLGELALKYSESVQSAKWLLDQAKANEIELPEQLRKKLDELVANRENG